MSSITFQGKKKSKKYKKSHKVKKDPKKEKKHKKEKNIKKSDEENKEDELEKEKPNFTPSGILAKYSAANIGGFVLKFTVPMDAKYPVDNWKLFPFKENQSLAPINLMGKTSFLIGREEQICDVYLQNPSVSTQHAVIQFRGIRQANDEDLNADTIVKPYIMDLESTNGTKLNKQSIEGARYYELKDQDMLQFGNSQREFVLIRE